MDYVVLKVDKSNLGGKYHYRDWGKLSIPCPCCKCTYGGFSEFFDRYDDNHNLFILTKGEIRSKPAEKASFTWDDWIYLKGRKYTILKQSMKRCIEINFARFIHLETYKLWKKKS